MCEMWCGGGGVGRRGFLDLVAVLSLVRGRVRIIRGGGGGEWEEGRRTFRIEL